VVRLHAPVLERLPLHRDHDRCKKTPECPQFRQGVRVCPSPPAGQIGRLHGIEKQICRLQPGVFREIPEPGTEARLGKEVEGGSARDSLGGIHGQRRDREISIPSTAASTSPTTPAMMRWLSGSFFPHSQGTPDHFPVVTRALTDSMQGQVFMKPGYSKSSPDPYIAPPSASKLTQVKNAMEKFRSSEIAGELPSSSLLLGAVYCSPLIPS